MYASLISPFARPAATIGVANRVGRVSGHTGISMRTLTRGLPHRPTQSDLRLCVLQAGGRLLERAPDARKAA